MEPYYAEVEPLKLEWARLCLARKTLSTASGGEKAALPSTQIFHFDTILPSSAGNTIE
jgi:hypothetical protein